MPSSDILLSFLVASVVIAFIPGPSMLYAAAQTMALGRLAGWWSAIGFHVAGLGHIGMAALGASTLLYTMPRLFTAMQLLGAAYLTWMGVRNLLTQHDRQTPTSNSIPARSGRKALVDSVIVEIFNPKSLVFFFIFLPQFTDQTAHYPVWLQVIILGTVVNVIFTVTDILSIEVSHAAVRRAKGSPGFALNIQRAGGIILVLLGVKLAVSGT